MRLANDATFVRAAFHIYTGHCRSYCRFSHWCFASTLVHRNKKGYVDAPSLILLVLKPFPYC